MSEPPRPTPKPGILEIAPYTAGKQKAAGFETPIKLSSNENALGCSPKALEAYLAAAARLHLYPDPRATRLREAVAARYGLEPERLVFGAGTDELFGLICHTYVEPGDSVIQPQHGFFAYRIAARAAQGELRFAPEQDFTVDVDSILEHVDDRTRVIFLANPGNPTGTWIGASELRRLHAALPTNVLLVYDAAYAEFAAPQGDYDDGLALARDAENVVVTRTFSKIFGLAALRVGWGYGPPEVVSAIDRIRPPFNVTIPAQEAGVAALDDVEFERRSVALIEEQRPSLAAALTSLGLALPPSATNFLFAGFPQEPGRTAAEARTFLESRGVLVRPVANYGLPDHLRITVGTESENRAVVDGLTAFFSA